ncbi:MAG: Aldehyde reductase [Candidatus Magasanikbacteria bacterium GW2011_GWA2_56_11]|uniref:Aldehyde reductase n=1 Tax=Candidatus Magasanikbacteria bacterium GW2011_GWA2_56_11 TaxID=1619044 RepID=A0A0G2B8J3_9BACT|nr:MAG: Aldehyde reductase [Candidatus Magasanikbacteria bacterium GW2011_GWA2_56_11]
MTGVSRITLNTGASMPSLGLGTYKSPPEKVGAAVAYAVGECGYRHVDCAAVYENEKEIGAALAAVFSAQKAAREEVFITGKLWNNAHAAADVAAACRQTLSDLRLDYLDLYLMHWGVAFPREAPVSGGEPLRDENGVLITSPVPVRETWEAMEELVRSGLVRAIGVSNFTAPMLLDLLSYAQVPPAMNQIELHPYNQQTRLLEFCHYNKIAVTAYSPLGRAGVVKESGEGPVLTEDAAVCAIAKSHGKSPAQVLIRWGLERGTVVIPKSATPENILANSAVFDFCLSKEEMDELAKLERAHRYLDPYERWRVPYFG